MTLSLLTTKLMVPPLRSVRVPRPCLMERLDAGVTGKLTLVSAPAGFGKTTLLSEWAGSRPATVNGVGVCTAWLSLDAGDNDPSRFLGYLLAALRTVEAGLGRGLDAAIEAPDVIHSESVLTPMLNELVALDVDIVLILDDYHVISLLAVHKVLIYLLDHLPPRLHLVIASRSDPPLPLSRLRGRGQLTELRAADLRFSADETAALFREMLRLPVATESLRPDATYRGLGHGSATGSRGDAKPDRCR